MEKQYELTITQIQDVLENKEWIELRKELEESAEKTKAYVLLQYLDREFYEVDKFNFKNAVARQLAIVLEIKEKLEAVNLSGMNVFISFLDDMVSDYEKHIKDKLVADALVSYTETDLMLREATTKLALTKWFDEQIEKLKKPKAEDNVLDRIRED